MSKSYTGINIQWPISELIISGEKTIETRTYPIPENYLNQEMLLIETPGKSGKFKARIRAIIIFKKCFKYSSKTQFHKDVKKHCVEKGSIWDWKDKPKWGWEVEVVKILTKPKPVKKHGIVYRKDIKLN